VLRRETGPTGLQVEDPYVHGCEGAGGKWLGLSDGLVAGGMAPDLLTLTVVEVIT
jgi:hypothetical protein